MHKVRGNYSSCTSSSNENICNSNGGRLLKGKRGQNKMKLYLSQKNGAFLNFKMDLKHQHVYYYMGESIQQTAIWWIYDSEGMWIVIPVNDQYTMSLVLSTISGII